MAVLVDSADRESELLALKLQEEELRLQQDALLAQRLAIAYASRHNEDICNDVEFVMEVAAANEETAQLAQLETQISEVQNKRSRLAIEDLKEIHRYQERVARNSRVVAEALEDQERWKANVVKHDAAFARKLSSIDEDTWEDIGDEIEDPLVLPPPRSTPTVPEEPVPAAVLRASTGSAGCCAPGRRDSKPIATTSRQPTTRMTARSSTGEKQLSNLPQPQPQPGSRTTTAPPKSAPPQGTTTTCSAGAASASGFARSQSGEPPSAKRPRWGPPVAAAQAGPSSAGVQPGPSTSGSAVHAAAAATIECLCCFDRFAEGAVTCAGADASSSSTASAGCGHYFCKGCITEYVRGAVKDGKHPISCPMAGAAAGGAGGGRGGQGRGGGCRLTFSRNSVLAALDGHPKELQAFGLLEAEQTIDQSMRIYCPHKSCSVLLVRPDPEELPKDAPISCPACQRAFCVNCLIPGWHYGYTCAQFQALPAHLRSAEDAAVLQLSATQQWKQCTQCKQVVERSEGCNHMLCRCGSSFCYKCGQPYKDTKPTPGNVHGTPACGCPLFDIPEDIEEDEHQPYGGGGAAGGHDDGHRYRAIMPAPWRGGRVVKRRCCRFSASIYNCPYGRKCWYWHEAEDGPV